MTASTRRRAGLAALLLAFLSVQCGDDGQPPAHTATLEGSLQARTSGLVVHEWGTFTSMQDSTGAVLGGMHHDDAPLPDFVHRRHLHLAIAPGADAPDEPTQRMETPVLYFHTKKALAVTAEVRFPFGLISEWYPDCAATLPDPEGISAIEGGSMKWRVQVDPALDAALVPAVPPGSIWAPARNVAVPALRAVDLLGSDTLQPEPTSQVEKFVFYRGVGRFEMPVRVTSAPAGTLAIANDAPETVAAAFLLHVPGDGTGALAELGALPGRSSRTVALPAPLVPLPQFTDRARPALVAALQHSGLRADEAWAMVDTWTSSYFATRGLRVLYVVPRPWTDALLPLRVTPQPDAVVRTLVGRVEVLTPAIEAEVRTQVQAWHAARTAGGFEGATELLKALHPYAESKLERVCPQLAEGALRDGCRALHRMAHHGW